MDTAGWLREERHETLPRRKIIGIGLVATTLRQNIVVSHLTQPVRDNDIVFGYQGLVTGFEACIINFAGARQKARIRFSHGNGSRRLFCGANGKLYCLEYGKHCAENNDSGLISSRESSKCSRARKQCCDADKSIGQAPDSGVALKDTNGITNRKEQIGMVHFRFPSQAEPVTAAAELSAAPGFVDRVDTEYQAFQLLVDVGGNLHLTSTNAGVLGMTAGETAKNSGP